MWIEPAEDQFWTETFQSVRIHLEGCVGVIYDGTDLSIVNQVESQSGDMCWLWLTPYQIAQVARGLQAIQQEQFCPKCGGEGDVKLRYSPEDEEYDLVQCPDCAGPGLPKEREAEPCQKL